MTDDEFQQLANAAWMEKFAERLTERGYGNLLADEASLKRALQAVEVLSATHEKAAQQVRPIVDALSIRALDALLSGK